MAILRLVVGIVLSFVLWAFLPGPAAYVVFALVAIVPEFLGGGRESTRRQRAATAQTVDSETVFSIARRHSTKRAAALAITGAIGIVLVAVLVAARGSSAWTVLLAGLAVASLGAAVRSALDIQELTRARRLSTGA